MKRVIIESPYRGDGYEDLALNMEYLQECIRDSLRRGEAPFASHQMYTTALDDKNPEHRRLGIAAGTAWARSADLRVFYLDRGWSTGMRHARELYDMLGLAYEMRGIRLEGLESALAAALAETVPE